MDHIRFEVDQGIQAASNNWYQCIQHLGTGGNAVTFLVVCTSGSNNGVLFALKVFRRLSQVDRRQRFLDEAAFLETCSHPALMRLFDNGVYRNGRDEFPFVVAEYLPERLFDVMRGGRATITQKISYSIQLLSALAYMQALTPQVVHRDIKPQNVFVKGGSCVLGDFGLMKLLDGARETDREIFKLSIGPGMPFFYRTPDLIAYARNEADISTKSDVFQLGLVLAELFTGWNPAIRPADILEPLALEPLRIIPGELSGSIAALINRMLIADPAQRPAALELLDGWRSLFMNAVKRAHSLDGRAL
jgi:serine/threonine protein kinase